MIIDRRLESRIQLPIFARAYHLWNYFPSCGILRMKAGAWASGIASQVGFRRPRTMAMGSNNDFVSSLSYLLRSMYYVRYDRGLQSIGQRTRACVVQATSLHVLVASEMHRCRNDGRMRLDKAARRSYDMPAYFAGLLIGDREPPPPKRALRKQSSKAR